MKILLVISKLKYKGGTARARNTFFGRTDPMAFAVLTRDIIQTGVEQFGDAYSDKLVELMNEESEGE